MNRREFLTSSGLAATALMTGCEYTGQSDRLVANHSSAVPGAALVPNRQRNAVYELRIYTLHPGRTEALLNRFRNHTLRLFQRHGIESLGYWMPTDPSDLRLHFLLRYPSREAREASWKAFMADPEWKAAQKASEADGPIVAKVENPYLQLTDYSAVFPTGNVSKSGVFELRVYTTPAGGLANLDARFRNHTLALFEKHGIHNVAYFHKLADQPGADSTLLYFVTHKSQAAAKASFASFGADPAWKAAREASEKAAGGSLTVPGGVKSYFLQPTDFSPTR